MLATLARAASPAAIDLLLAQPQRWRDAAARNDVDAAVVMRTTAALDHLVTPPTVVLVGRDYWKGLVNFDWMVEHAMIDRDDLNLFTICDNAEEAWAALIDRGLTLPD